MATKPKPKPTPGRLNTPLLMLTRLHDDYTFGPRMDAAIACIIEAHDDPLQRLPPGVANLSVVNDRLIRFTVDDQWNSVIRKDNGTVVLGIGCVFCPSREHAQDYWRGGASRSSGRPRPTRAAQIDWVSRVCAHRGWTW